VALGTLVILMIPVYISSLKAAQGYGRLEQKVDQLALSQASTATQNAETARLLAETVSKLSSAFQDHAVQDAGHFGELRGLMGAAPTKP
jgi:hypothetical protein